MEIAWRTVAVAGVLGYAGGQAASKLKDRPDLVLPVIQVSAASGIAGALVGWGVSAYRNVPSYAHSFSLAANFAVVSATFMSIRTLVECALSRLTSLSTRSHQPSSSPTPPPITRSFTTPTTTHYISSITSGGITGALTSIVSRYGLRSMLLTSLGGMGMGLCAQAGYNGVMEWRRKKAIELYHQDIGRRKEGIFDHWTLDNFEARFLGFWHQKSEAIQVETEIVTLEVAIAEERKKLAQLDKLLTEKEYCIVRLHPVVATPQVQRRD